MDTERKIMIFDAIEQVLEEEGVGCITYANISARCHLHTNTITYYFANKGDMLIQFFQHVVDRDNARLPRFYEALPPDMTPVEAVCALVDHIIDGGRFKSRTRRLINQYLLPYTELSPQVRDFLYDLQNKSMLMELACIQRYEQYGVLCSDRLRQAFADLTLVSSGLSMITFFNVQCPDCDYAVEQAKERIKRSVLKDGLYPPF